MCFQEQNGYDLCCFLGGWEKIWAEGRTLWDLGEATPIVVHLCETGSLPNGRALVPGCGTVSRFDFFFSYHSDSFL